VGERTYPYSGYPLLNRGLLSLHIHDAGHAPRSYQDGALQTRSGLDQLVNLAARGHMVSLDESTVQVLRTLHRYMPLVQETYGRC